MMTTPVIRRSIRLALLGLVVVGSPALAAMLMIDSGRDETACAKPAWRCALGEVRSGAKAALADWRGRNPAGGRDQVVSSAEELSRAVAQAANGAVIRLAPGDYPQVTIIGRDDRAGRGGVTITSADPARPARIGMMLVRNTRGLTIRQMEFAANPANTTSNSFQFLHNTRLTLDRIRVYGPENTEQAYQLRGMLVRDSDDVTITNLRFFNLQSGLHLLNATHVKVIGSEFWNLRIDGIHGGGVSDALIAGNVFTDFHPVPGDHPDAIQLWSTDQQEPGRRIMIRDNLVVRGTGTQTQGVFIRDTHNVLPFEGVEIVNNLMIGTLYNGIAVDGLIGGRIEGNAVIALSDQKSWIRLQSARDVAVRNNNAPHFIILKSSGVEDKGNHVTGAQVSYRRALHEWLDTPTGQEGVTRRRQDSVLLPLLEKAAP